MISLAGILVLPESPRWLLAHDKHEEARHILWALEPNAKAVEASDPVIDREMAEIQHAIYEEKAAAYDHSFPPTSENDLLTLGFLQCRIRRQKSTAQEWTPKIPS
jgi:hypothetical protein